MSMDVAPVERPLVVVIEDEPDLRQLVVFNLRAEGFEALGAATAGEGLAICSMHRPAVVVLDRMLGDVRRDRHLRAASGRREPRRCRDPDPQRARFGGRPPPRLRRRRRRLRRQAVRGRQARRARAEPRRSWPPSAWQCEARRRADRRVCYGGSMRSASLLLLTFVSVLDAGARSRQERGGADRRGSGSVDGIAAGIGSAQRRRRRGPGCAREEPRWRARRPSRGGGGLGSPAEARREDRRCDQDLGTPMRSIACRASRAGTDGADREMWSLRELAHTLVGPTARVVANHRPARDENGSTRRPGRTPRGRRSCTPRGAERSSFAGPTRTASGATSRWSTCRGSRSSLEPAALQRAASG